MRVIILLCLVGFFSAAECAGPWVQQTQGQPWPLPQTFKQSPEYLVLRQSHFEFRASKNQCPTLDEAMKRYRDLIFKPSNNLPPRDEQWRADSGYAGDLTEVEVYVQNKCEHLPSEHMDEQYVININNEDKPGSAKIVSGGLWGALRALETFSQILVPLDGKRSQYRVNTTTIRDFPRFPFRGLLLDTSRHYLPVPVIIQNLDLMATNKMNVLHWHIVDNPSFPYQSKTFPNISELGAYRSPSHVYTQLDVEYIIEYARKRGIRVLVEFDTPAHVASWGVAFPSLLADCEDELKPKQNGHLDPTLASTYSFIEQFFGEIQQVFPDSVLHLGGDEVDFSCWLKVPSIVRWMEKHNMTKGEELEQFYITRLQEIISRLDRRSMMWQEVVDSGLTVQPNTIIDVWKNGNRIEEMGKVTKLGFTTVLSSCWYLNYISYGIDWGKYYTCDPQQFNGTDAQKQLVIGGKACMWGEFVDSTNQIITTWARASAAAERFWSAQNVNDVDEAAPRLEEHRCRMLGRGYSVEPVNGPGYCDVIYPPAGHGPIDGIDSFKDRCTTT